MAQRQLRVTHMSGMALTDRPGVSGRHEGTSDPLTQEANIRISLVASAAEQTIPDFTSPVRGMIVDAYLNTIVPSTSGAAETISIGITGSSTALFNAVVTDAIVPLAGTKDVATAGQSLVFTLGAADLDVYQAELVIRYIDWDDAAT